MSKFLASSLLRLSLSISPLSLTPLSCPISILVALSQPHTLSLLHPLSLTSLLLHLYFSPPLSLSLNPFSLLFFIFIFNVDCNSFIASPTSSVIFITCFFPSCEFYLLLLAVSPKVFNKERLFDNKKVMVGLESNLSSEYFAEGYFSFLRNDTRLPESPFLFPL